jgi:hypothetical protein
MGDELFSRFIPNHLPSDAASQLIEDEMMQLAGLNLDLASNRY